jgi:hypothetical protein
MLLESSDRSGNLLYSRSSNNFVSHYATKGKFHKNQFYKKSIQRSRTPVKNEFYNGNRSNSKRSRSVSKNKFFKRESIIDDKRDDKQRMRLGGFSMKGRKFIKNPNFKSKQRNPLFMNFTSKKSSTRKYSNFLRSPPSQKYENSLKSNSNSKEEQMIKFQPFPDKSNYEASENLLQNELENLFIRSNSNLALNISNNPVEIDSLFDSQSTFHFDEICKTCKFYQSHTGTSNAFCSDKCFRQAQGIYQSDKSIKITNEKESQEQQEDPNTSFYNKIQENAKRFMKNDFMQGIHQYVKENAESELSMNEVSDRIETQFFASKRKHKIIELK